MFTFSSREQSVIFIETPPVQYSITNPELIRGPIYHHPEKTNAVIHNMTCSWIWRKEESLKSQLLPGLPPLS